MSRLFPIRIACGLIALFLLARLLTLGSIPLTDPSEGRYASIAQEMYISDDWVTPRTFIDDTLVPFEGKPPLHAWATTISYTLFGMNEFSARFPSFIAALGICMCAGLFAWRAFSLPVALVSIAILLSSFLFFLLSGACLTDPILSLFISIALASSAWWAFGEGKYRDLAAYLCFLALALGFITKGPVAIILVGMALGPWLLITGRWRELKYLPWLGGLSLFLIVTIPWFAAAEQATPGFVRYFFVNENLLRFTIKNYGDKYGSGHRQPYGMIWLMLTGAFLPWSIALILGLFSKEVRSELRQPWPLFALCWGVAPALFFTVAQQISISYVLPGLPGLSVFTAWVIARSLEKQPRGIRSFLQYNRVIFSAIAVGAAVYGAFFGSHWPVVSSTFLFIVFFLGYCYLLERESSRCAWSDLFLTSCCATVGAFISIIVNMGPSLITGASPRDIIEELEDTSVGPLEIGMLGKTPQSAFFYSRGEEFEGEDKTTLFPVIPKDVLESDLMYFLGKRKMGDAVLKEYPKNFSIRAESRGWILLERE